MTSKMKFIVSIVVVVAVLGAGYGGFVAYTSYKNKKAEEAELEILAVKKKNYDDLSALSEIYKSVNSTIDSLNTSFDRDTNFSEENPDISDFQMDEVQMKNEYQGIEDTMKNLDSEKNSIKKGNAFSDRLIKYISDEEYQLSQNEKNIYNGNVFETEKDVNDVRGIENTEGVSLMDDLSTEMAKYQ